MAEITFREAVEQVQIMIKARAEGYDSNISPEAAIKLYEKIKNDRIRLLKAKGKAAISMKALTKIKDKEARHIMADEVLVELIKDLSCQSVATLYGSLKKWYA